MLIMQKFAIILFKTNLVTAKEIKAPRKLASGELVFTRNYKIGKIIM